MQAAYFCIACYKKLNKQPAVIKLPTVSRPVKTK